MEAVQFALQFGVRCPRFAAVEESADYAGVVHCHLGWSCQLWVLPDTGCNASKGCGSLTDAHVDISVEGQVVTLKNRQKISL